MQRQKGWPVWPARAEWGISDARNGWRVKGSHWVRRLPVCRQVIGYVTLEEMRWIGTCD